MLSHNDKKNQIDTLVKHLSEYARFNRRVCYVARLLNIQPTGKDPQYLQDFEDLQLLKDISYEDLTVLNANEGAKKYKEELEFIKYVLDYSKAFETSPVNIKKLFQELITNYNPNIAAACSVFLTPNEKFEILSKFKKDALTSLLREVSDARTQEPRDLNLLENDRRIVEKETAYDVLGGADDLIEALLKIDFTKNSAPQKMQNSPPLNSPKATIDKEPNDSKHDQEELDTEKEVQASLDKIEKELADFNTESAPNDTVDQSYKEKIDRAEIDHAIVRAKIDYTREKIRNHTQCLDEAKERVEIKKNCINKLSKILEDYKKHLESSGIKTDGIYKEKMAVITYLQQDILVKLNKKVTLNDFEKDDKLNDIIIAFNKALGEQPAGNTKSRAAILATRRHTLGWFDTGIAVVKSIAAVLAYALIIPAGIYYASTKKPVHTRLFSITGKNVVENLKNATEQPQQPKNTKPK